MLENVSDKRETDEHKFARHAMMPFNLLSCFLRFVPMTTAEIIVSLWAGTRGYLDKAWKPLLPTHTILQRAFRRTFTLPCQAYSTFSEQSSCRFAAIQLLSCQLVFGTGASGRPCSLLQVATKEILRFEALWLKHFKDTKGDVLKASRLGERGRGP